MPDLINDVPESHRDLVRSPFVATLTTIDRHGRPQSTAVWYLLDDDGLLKASVTADRQKYRNLKGNPACDLFIIDPANPFRTLEIRADAELTPDPEQSMVYRFATAYGVDSAMLLAAGGDRHTVTFRPRHIVATP